MADRETAIATLGSRITASSLTPQTVASRSSRVAVAGLGAVGLKIAETLDKGIPGCILAAVSAKDIRKAQEKIARFAHPKPVVAIEHLEPLADIVVECAPASLLPSI